MQTVPSQVNFLRMFKTPANGWLVLGLLFFGLYSFATLAPRGDTWGLHALAYLPSWARALGLATCLCLLWRPIQERAVVALSKTARPFLADSSFGRLLLGLVMCAGFVIFYSFPIQTEVYGDTRTIVRQWTATSGLSISWLSSLLDMRLQLNDAPLTGLLVRSIARTFSMPIDQAFRLLSALSGALSVGLWTQFVRSTFPGSRWAPLLLLVGYALGAYQIFFGHVETYAFVFLTTLMFILAGYLSLERRTSIWSVCFLFVLALRAHSTAILFLPALVFLTTVHFARRFPSLARLLTWQQVLRFLVTPCVAGGVALYLFYFRSLNVRHPNLTAASRSTFLPVVPSSGPWDYSLFSPAHILDLGNVLLLVGTPILLVAVGMGLFHRRAVAWGHPTVVFASIALGFPLLFFASVNPLLSLPRDWDLFALLGVPLLLFLTAVLSHSSEESVSPVAPYGTAMAFCVFSVSFWVLNASPEPLSFRLEQVGEHVFRTYHTSASYIIGSAEGMDPDTTRSIARRVATVQRLTPLAPRGDEEYSHLLMMLATAYRDRGYRDEAVHWVTRAAAVAPDDLNIALFRVDFLLWANETEGARQCLVTILARDSRSFDALVLAAIVAAKEGDSGRAVGYLERALEVRPGDPDVARWLADARSGRSQVAPDGRQR